jgi:SAM-dependent methyltransferase
MHPEASHFVEWVSETLPDYFAENTVVLDIGAADINGSNRGLFRGRYTGLDVAPGKNVDVVCKGSDAPFPDEHFDTIISTECLEHDMYYVDTLGKAYAMLRPGGLLVLTCAAEGRPEHGTPRTSPQDSLTSGLADPSWSNYYKNLNPPDIAAAFERHGGPFHDLFADHFFCINPSSHDTYFAGIKRGGAAPVSLPRYGQ